MSRDGEAAVTRCGRSFQTWGAVWEVIPDMRCSGTVRSVASHEVDNSDETYSDTNICHNMIVDNKHQLIKLYAFYRNKITYTTACIMTEQSTQMHIAV